MSFYQKLDQRLVQGALGDQLFLPLSTLDEFTKANITAQLPRMTRFFYRGLADKVLLHARKIFAILVLMGEQDTIRDILRDGLKDEDLPLSLPENGSAYTLVSWNRKVFKSFAAWGKEARVKEFLAKQWFVLAPVFERSGQRIELNTKCALPIVNTELIAGVNACMMVAPLLTISKDDEATVAIKEFRVKASFDHEEENLLKVQNLEHNHLIRIIATCDREPSYYVIFPWADGGNLREFWQDEDSHRTPELILWSLRQMLGLADGLKALHTENCRHGDLKPENILHFKKSDDPSDESQGNLVIADVGVSKFHREATKLRNLPTNTKATTPTYEAPEAHPDVKDPRSRVYDTWSMGCIYLEWVVWLLYGMNAVRRFRQARTSDDPMIEAGSFYIHAPQGTPPVHPKVSEAFGVLKEDPRCIDGTAFGDLLGLIAKDLLVAVDSRATASKLADQLGRIVHDAVQRPLYFYKQVDPPPDIPKFFTMP
ncbi:hypothetical protein AK830_g10020 [Neonectria ditissima]|uniref:Protein kinase domain-containing protein n=1 Tax=Neonectria ditissima TaxID=78410 RepID=A0A0P7B848_9HYPO|nr:hypothetical protein AK830_g10020 [Neonectria ditissima]